MINYETFKHRIRKLDNNGIDPMNLQDFIDRQNKGLATQEDCLRVLTNSAYFLEHISEELKTPEVCHQAVIKDPRTLMYVPDNLRTEAFHLKVMGAKLVQVEVYLHVQHMNKSEITPTIAQKGVWMLGEILKYVPNSMKTLRLCELALRIGEEWVDEYVPETEVLAYVPEHLKSADLCFEAVKANPWNIKQTPEKIITEDMAVIAVQRSRELIEFIPVELRTLGLCQLAIQNKASLRHIPMDFRYSKEIMDTYFKSNYDALSLIPEEDLLVKTDQDLERILDILSRTIAGRDVISYLINILEKVLNYLSDQSIRSSEGMDCVDALCEQLMRLKVNPESIVPLLEMKEAFLLREQVKGPRSKKRFEGNDYGL